MRVRLASWNIHKGIGGVDRRYLPERIIEQLRALDADIVLLQEVDDGARRSRFDRQVDLLGDALRLPHRAWWPNHHLNVGRYGNALLSRLPFREPFNLSLTLPLHKKRAALHARFAVDHLPHGLWIFNCHLGLAEAERRQQLRRILRHIDEHHGSEEHVVIAGDLNDVWQQLGPAVLHPAGFRSVPRPPLTFPAFKPLRPLDRVFVRGSIGIARCERVEGLLARTASDHRPLYVELSLS
ncbi:MAG: endonuclease/exonuclease/phosphatase family protein [Planctomycetes bacterium]|nr:endonuclease/exonuclease/phosphatase family protein [Planctomycetota bacterium]